MAERIYVERTYGSPEAAIIQPEKQVPVTAYNVDNWLPRLGMQRWALVQVLRRLALDAPQAPDGTRGLETTREELAERLGLGWPGTIGEWLKSEPIPGRKGWRRIAPVDEAAQALAHFIPRLRYTYNRGEDGKTRRTGLALYIRMDEPLTPEDKARLDTVAAAMMQERVEQGVLVDAMQDMKLENPTSRSVKLENPTSRNNDVNSENPTSQGVKSEIPILQTNGVKEENPTSHPPVKKGKPLSQATVKEEKPTSQGREVGKSYRNVNERTDIHRTRKDKRTDNDANAQRSGVTERWAAAGSEIGLQVMREIVNGLDLDMHDGRRIRAQLTPIVKGAEEILDDYHSTQMLYKVLKALYQTRRLDLFLGALGTAVEVGERDASANLGAVFVSEIKRLGQEEEVDVGLTVNGKRGVVGEYPTSGEGDRVEGRRDVTSWKPELLIPGYGDSRKLWDSALKELELQMTQATFNTWLSGTWIADYQSGASDDDDEVAGDGGGAGDGEGSECSERGECLVVRVANPYAADWLTNRLAPMIVRTLSGLVGRPVRVEFTVEDGH